MSKLSFRARALDASKPMPVFWSEEIPDLPDFAAINRAVPQMPTGMEKEEESEHHLQRAISAQQAYGQTGDLVIPTPEVDCGVKEYEKFYPTDFKIPKQLVHVQALNMEQDIPDYDMDTEDEEWVNQQSKKMEITPLQFEEMLDRLEKGSGQQVVTLKEAKLLLKEDDDLIIAVYDYWLNKRLKLQHPLIPQVKTEKRDGSTNNNPYVAFRRRTEKMQTRKNRKNDETSYEKMLKLRRDLSRAVTLLEMVKRREKSKRELLHLTVEIFEKRYQLGDFTGQILSEVSAIKHTQPSFTSVHSNQYTVNRHPNWTNRIDRVSREEVGAVRKKREYKKRKHKDSSITGVLSTPLPQYTEGDAHFTEALSSEEESISPGQQSISDHEDDNDPDGSFAFRRKKGCYYHAPHLDWLGNWPWVSTDEGGLAEKRYRYTLTTLGNPRRTIGFARRRVGRGGRILLDRAWTPLDEYLCELNVSSSPLLPNGLPGSEILAELKANHWLHFRPLTPPTENTDSPSSPRLSPGAVAVVPEFNVESFQSHQEQLVEMQRQQMERLRQQEEENSSQDSSHYSEHSASSHTNLTLDSATAQFAASAVITGNQVSSLINGASVASSVLTNGLATITPPNAGGELALLPQMQLGFSLSGSSMSQPSPSPVCMLPKTNKLFKQTQLAGDKVSGQGDTGKAKLETLMGDKVRIMEVT